MKRSFFPSSGRVDTAIWMHYLDANKMTGEKARRNYTRMLRAILNKSWRQHPTKHQPYGHLPPITKTIQVNEQTRRTLLEKQGRAHKRCTPMDSTYGEQKQDGQLGHIYSSYVRTQDVTPEDLPEANER